MQVRIVKLSDCNILEVGFDNCRGDKVTDGGIYRVDKLLGRHIVGAMATHALFKDIWEKWFDVAVPCLREEVVHLIGVLQRVNDEHIVIS